MTPRPGGQALGGPDLWATQFLQHLPKWLEEMQVRGHGLTARAGAKPGDGLYFTIFKFDDPAICCASKQHICLKTGRNRVLLGQPGNCAHTNFSNRDCQSVLFISREERMVPKMKAGGV